MTESSCSSFARRGLLALAGILILGAGPAFAADSAARGPSEVIFLGELLLLMAAGRLLGEAMTRIGQPSVMGQLLAGILLGPSVMGAMWPSGQHALFPAGPEQKAMIDAISQFGILLLLLLTGMETDLKLVRKVGRAAISISLMGVAIPFACGVTVGLFIPEALLPGPDKRLLTALFLGTALSISSIKIVAAIVREVGFARRNLGQVIVSSAIMEDTIGWIIIAVIFGLAGAGEIDVASVAKILIGTAVFLVASFTIGRRVVFNLIRLANDGLQSEFAVITTILLIMGAMAMTTHFIGVHTVLGAFVAGILIGESPILTKHIDEQLRGLIVAFFMPVFFGMAGLSADLTILRDPQLLLMALGLIAIASIGKFAGAFAGGEIGGLSRRESFALACGMNARGSTEVIVATIGLSMGALTQNLFTMIVAMAFATTMAMPPMLRFALARVPMREAERERLEREEFEAKGFVPNLERLLVAVDESPNGKFASRLAGLLAATRGLPITVLPLSAGGASRRAGRDQDETADGAEASVQAAATEHGERDKDNRPEPPDVLIRKPQVASAQAVADEAKKGYDLLFLGIARTRARGGAFHQDVTRIVATFDGPVAIVAVQGVHLREPERAALHVLVPVNGTEVSHRAAEVAIAIARASGSPISALYVADIPASRNRRNPRAKREEQAIVKDIVEMADRYDVKAKVAVRSHRAPAEAILAEAKEVNKKAEDTLIVMGVSRRPGENLSFGDTAAAVFENAPGSIVFIST